MITREIPIKTLDDEIARLEHIQKNIPPGKSYIRLKAGVAIGTLRWLRDGKLPPSALLE